MKLSFLNHYPGLDENDDRVYRNFNILLILGLADISIIALGLLKVEPSWPFYLCITQWVCFLFMLVLHTHGHFVIARFTTFILALGVQSLACITHGKSAGFDLLFFIIGVLPILFFDNHKYYGSLFILTLITHLSIQYAYRHFEPFIVIDSALPYYWNTFVTGVLIFFALHLFKKGYLRTQKSLREYNKQILYQKEEIEVINNNLESMVKERTAKIMEHEKLFIEFAHINAHRVRGPLARILGLIKVIDLEPHNRIETMEQVLPAIKTNAEELSQVLKEVGTMLNNTSLSPDSGKNQ